jgi:hypothetical protein
MGSGHGTKLELGASPRQVFCVDGYGKVAAMAWVAMAGRASFRLVRACPAAISLCTGQPGEVVLRAALALSQTVILTRINADKQG